mmetsp:Transcript_46713/g.130336  ORF Transcript_46713/g.130336 Transcript_46713/m.130336 type:complete len:214 (+) Transcript_46713:1196-1837(+)
MARPTALCCLRATMARSSGPMVRSTSCPPARPRASRSRATRMSTSPPPGAKPSAFSRARAPTFLASRSTPRARHTLRFTRSLSTRSRWAKVPEWSLRFLRTPRMISLPSGTFRARPTTTRRLTVSHPRCTSRSMSSISSTSPSRPRTARRPGAATGAPSTGRRSSRLRTRETVRILTKRRRRLTTLVSASVRCLWGRTRARRSLSPNPRRSRT